MGKALRKGLDRDNVVRAALERLDRGDEADASELLELSKAAGRSTPWIVRLKWETVEDLCRLLGDPKTQTDFVKVASVVGPPAGWTLRDLAKMLGVSKVYISQCRWRAALWDPELFEFTQSKVRELLMQHVRRYVREYVSGRERKH